MKFSRLVDFFENLQETSSRNDIIGILKQLFKKTTEENIDIVCYFLLGNIAAGYKDVNLGMGDEMVKSAIGFAANLDEDAVEQKMRELGDLGDVAFKVIGKKERRFEDFLETENQPTITDVHEGLMKIAKAKGANSVEFKEKILASLLSNTTPKERRFIVRMVVGEMRLGIGDMTVLDGLASTFLESKDDRDVLEQAYNVSSDIGYVAKILIKSGLSGVKRVRIALNRPLRPMLAQRVSEMSSIMEKIVSDVVAAEEKFDGERIQAHKEKDSVKLFSRRLTDVTAQFPEVVEAVKEQVSVDKAILDGEVVAYDFERDEFYPFQKLMQRRRKYNVDDYAEKIPVKYMVFDILYLDGNSYLRKSYPKRRKQIKKIVKSAKFIGITNRITSDKLDDIDDFFQNCLKRGLEGIVCKSCAANSFYRAGARDWTWIKWKQSYASELSDTFDLTVIGAYSGKGKRAGNFGALLCAAYDHEKDIFQTACKLGSGFSDDQLDGLPEKFRSVELDKKPVRVEVTKSLVPDYWFTSKFVLEVLASEITESPVHTCNWNEKEKKGLALRFPRFVRWRPEKSPEQSTSVEEIVAMFQKQ